MSVCASCAAADPPGFAWSRTTSDKTKNQGLWQLEGLLLPLFFRVLPRGRNLLKHCHTQCFTNGDN